MSRVLLVSPSRNYPMKNEMYPSGALLMLGTLLKKQGHEVRVVHMVADKVDVDGFQDTVLEFYPDIVGFTVSTYQTKMTKILMNKIRVISRGRIIIVAGGPHPSALRSGFLVKFPNTDIVVCGEGEDAITDIADGVPLHRISGICYRKGRLVISNDRAPLRSNLDGLPLPDRSLINFKRYAGLFPVGRRPSMFIMSSRGCPYNCTFCSKSVYGNTLRLRTPNSIMGEVEMLYRDWGVREIHFGDDTFNASRTWADELLDLIIKKGYHKKLTFRVALRVNEKVLGMDLLKHLKAAGVWLACYGVESGNQDMLDHMMKGITVEEIIRAFALTHLIGIKTEAYFIVGMPGENLGTIQDSINLYRSIKPYWGGFSRAMPFPGTAFTEEVRRSGHLLCDNYDMFGPAMVSVRTDSLSSDEVETWVSRLNAMARRDKVRRPKQLAYAIRDKMYGRW